MSVIELPELISDALVAESDIDQWKKTALPDILKQMSEWDKWKYDLTRKQDDFVKLIKQVAEWRSMEYMSQFPGSRTSIAFGDPDRARIILFTATMSREQADLGYFTQNVKPSTHEQFADLLSRVGMDTRKIMFSACVPFFPGAAWGPNKEGNGFNVRPPKHIERAVMFFIRQLVRIVQPTFVIATNSLSAELLTKASNLASLTPSAFANYVAGSNEGSRGPTIKFDNMGALSSYPFYYSGTQVCTAIRLYHPFYLSRSTGTIADTNRIMQASLYKDITSAVSGTTGVGSLAKRSRNADVFAAFRKKPKVETSEDTCLNVKDVEMFDKMLLLTTFPICESDWRYLEETGYRIWIDMCSVTRNPRKQTISVVPTPIENFQNHMDRWTEDRMMELINLILNAWSEKMKVAVYCNDGMKENSMLAACFLCWVYPHLSPEHATKMITERRGGTDYVTGNYLKVLENFWRKKCWGRLELFLGKMSGDGYDWTVCAALDSSNYFKVARFNSMQGAKIFGDYCSECLKNKATTDEAVVYIVERSDEGNTFMPLHSTKMEPPPTWTLLGAGVTEVEAWIKRNNSSYSVGKVELGEADKGFMTEEMLHDYFF